MKTKKTHDAAAAYKDHLREISTLLLNSMNRVDTQKESAGERAIDWGDVGTAGRVRELVVEMAWTLGVITIEEAKKKHGVIL